eukprot:3318092-Pyramimonas_sp.AAC.1
MGAPWAHRQLGGLSADHSLFCGLARGRARDEERRRGRRVDRGAPRGGRFFRDERRPGVAPRAVSTALGLG